MPNPNKNSHGGRRKPGPGKKLGRPSVTLKRGQKRRAVWIIATPEEQDLINTGLTTDERKLILLQSVVAKQNGNDWWNAKTAAAWS